MYLDDYKTLIFFYTCLWICQVLAGPCSYFKAESQEIDKIYPCSALPMFKCLFSLGCVNKVSYLPYYLLQQGPFQLCDLSSAVA